MQILMGDDRIEDEMYVERVEFLGIRAVHFVIYGVLGNGYLVLFESMFGLVHLSHPDQPRGCQHRGRISQNASPIIETQRQKKTWDRDSYGNVDIADVKLTDATVVGTGTVAAAQPTWLDGLTVDPVLQVSSNLLDPFDTLCESPERLRQLLRHRKAPTPHRPCAMISG
ncbi:hypothetical protein IL306_005041 [Fusarium sp. DS 682]|nr:hypothetical protein IL306_005041 [Fusarium sp. DS 682]